MPYFNGRIRRFMQKKITASHWCTIPEKNIEQCHTVELDHIIREACWRMLGHALGMLNETATKLSIFEFLDKLSDCLKGRPRTTLQLVLNKDLNRDIHPHRNY